MNKENISEALVYKSSAMLFYVEICEKRENRNRPPNCDVHHINGNHSDNTPENLMIVTEEMHKWLHTGTSRVNPWMRTINWYDFRKELEND